MDASRMMARMATITQKKNATMPGMAYPATVLALATATSYPPPPGLFARGSGNTGLPSAKSEVGQVSRHALPRMHHPVRRTTGGLTELALASNLRPIDHPGNTVGPRCLSPNLESE